MPSANAHRLINFSATTALLSALELDNKNRRLVPPLIGGALSAAFATLPDAIEPAIHPHHRQFFHSVAFGTLVAYGAYKAYRWGPRTRLEGQLRIVAIIGASAYLLHLVADAVTARSLPLVGT